MAPKQGNAPLAGKTILVIEDEYFLADDVSRALTMAGAGVVGPFGDVPEGLAAIESGLQLSSAVLDVNLRDKPVFPIADALHQRGVPFVFTTGYDKASIPASYLDVPRCEKPIDVAELVQVLGKM